MRVCFCSYFKRAEKIRKASLSSKIKFRISFGHTLHLTTAPRACRMGGTRVTSLGVLVASHPLALQLPTGVRRARVSAFPGTTTKNLKLGIVIGLHFKFSKK